MRKSDERLRGSCLLIRNMRRLFAILGDSWPIFPIRNPSIIQLITPPPPSLIFRITGLRTFSLQMIDPQWLTSKFLFRNDLRGLVIPTEPLQPRVEGSAVIEVVTITTAQSDNWPLATGYCFWESFLGSYTGCGHRGHNNPSSTSLIPRRAWVPQVLRSRFDVMRSEKQKAPSKQKKLEWGTVRIFYT